MTDTFLWDASHYDGTLTVDILTKAKAEGIEGFTHKLGEGMTNVDDTADTALAAARDVGIRALGGYWFVHGNDDPVAEAKRCIAVADKYEPWWRTFDGWFWQTDAETSTSGLPSPAYVKTFSDTLAALSGRKVIVYASHGMYGDTLTGLGHPLWNANYPSSRQAGFKDLYPGDTFTGWNRYSGQTPVICQYSSSATIAGLTTCDANVFRGSIDDLLTLVGADMPLTDSDAGVVAAHKTPDGETWIGATQDSRVYAKAAMTAALANAATLAGIVKSEAALQATLNTLAAGGGNVDTAALAAQIKTIGDAESAAFAAQGKQLTTALANEVALIAQLAALRTALAAGDTAAAAALAAK